MLRRSRGWPAIHSTGTCRRPLKVLWAGFWRRLRGFFGVIVFYVTLLTN